MYSKKKMNWCCHSNTVGGDCLLNYTPETDVKISVQLQNCISASHTANYICILTWYCALFMSQTEVMSQFVTRTEQFTLRRCKCICPIFLQFLLIFRRAAAGELQEESGLMALARLSEINVSTEGVMGAKDFFEAKVWWQLVLCDAIKFKSKYF